MIEQWQTLLKLVVTIALVGCTDGNNALDTHRNGGEEVGSLSVYVVNYPLLYFAERIGDDAVRVTFPAPADGDPAYWSPDAETIAAYQDADLILLNGAGYAKWVQRATLPPSKLVNTSESVQDQHLIVEDSVIHTHGPKGEHNHGDIAFTTWLDPTLAVDQARAIRDVFTAARPEREAKFQEQFESLESDLLNLDDRLRDIVAREPGKALLASHPVYQYLTRRYDLNLESVHFEPDQYPDEKDWQKLEALLAKHPAQWMLWEAKPLEESARKLKELGIESVVFAPCGNAPADGDFLVAFRRNLAELESLFTRARSTGDAAPPVPDG